MDSVGLTSIFPIYSVLQQLIGGAVVSGDIIDFHILAAAYYNLAAV